jgi:hypothetical protein
LSSFSAAYIRRCSSVRGNGADAMESSMNLGAVGSQKYPTLRPFGARELSLANAERGTFS